MKSEKKYTDLGCSEPEASGTWTLVRDGNFEEVVTIQRGQTLGTNL